MGGFCRTLKSTIKKNMVKGKRTCKNCKSTNMKYEEVCLASDVYECQVRCQDCEKYWGTIESSI